MVYVGALLSSMNMRQALRRPSIYLISLNKLILIPALLAVVYAYMLMTMGRPMSFAAFAVVVLEAAMPCQTIVVVLTKRYGGNFELAASNMLITTILSLATLPLIYRLIERVYL